MFDRHCNLAKDYNNIRRQMTKRRPIFTHVPDWMGIYHPGKITINNPQFHYYISRSELDQPVTLYMQNDEEQASRPMKMYFAIEPAEGYSQTLWKDQSSIKDFSHLSGLQENQMNKISISKQSITKQSSWIKKYEPNRFIDLLTDQLHNRNVLTWLKSWDSIVFHKNHKVDTVPSLFKNNTTKNNFKNFYHQEYNYKKLILLAGPPGCGKTTLARVIAKHCGYHWQEINASDDRSAKALISKIDNLASNQTLRAEKKPTCIIIDQVDGALDSDSNGIKEVLNYLETGVIVDGPKKQKADSKHPNASKPKQQAPNKQNRYKNYKSFPKKTQAVVQQQRKTKIDRPVIFICNDPFVKGLKDLRKKAIVVYFNTLQEDRVVKRLKEITQYENIYIQTDLLTKICQMCNNDVRSSLGLLQLLVQLKNQLNLTAKQVLSRMKFSYIKDVNSSTNEFLSKVMQPITKNNAQTNIFKNYQYYLSQHDNHSLLSQTFFQNILNNSHIFLRMEHLIGLYKEITQYDVMGKQSFTYHMDPSQFAVFPYAFYRIHIRAEEHKRIQFPANFFDKLNKYKSNVSLVDKILKGIPSNLIAFISKQSLVLDYLYAFWLTMQTSSVRQQDVLRCVYKLLAYGIKLGVRNSPHLFNPQMDVLLTFGTNKPQINFSLSSRVLMQQNYEFLKLKSQLISEDIFDSKKQNLQTVLNQLKRNRRKKRDTQNGQVKYKYLEGTGTQVKYDLKIGYFFIKA